MEDGRPHCKCRGDGQPPGFGPDQLAEKATDGGLRTVPLGGYQSHKEPELGGSRQGMSYHHDVPVRDPFHLVLVEPAGLSIDRVRRRDLGSRIEEHPGRPLLGD